jgi:hypothetical protein
MTRPQHNEPAHWRKQRRRPVQYLDPPMAVEEIDRTSRRGRRERSRRPAEGGTSPRPVRDLTPEEQRKVAEISRGRIVRPHKHPWLPPDLDLADLPCACTSEVPCLLHKLELGGPRPYVR